MRNTKDLIVSAATDLFLSKGYENVSITDILEKANVSRGAFYYHFDSVKTLYNQICYTLFTEPYAAFETIYRDKSLNAFEKILEFDSILSMYPRKNELNKSIDSGDNPFMFETQIQISFNDCAPLYAKLIQQGNEEGIFNCEDPLSTAEVYCVYYDVFLCSLFTRNSSDTLARRIHMHDGLLKSLGIVPGDKPYSECLREWKIKKGRVK